MVAARADVCAGGGGGCGGGIVRMGGGNAVTAWDVAGLDSAFAAGSNAGGAEPELPLTSARKILFTVRSLSSNFCASGALRRPAPNPGPPRCLSSRPWSVRISRRTSSSSVAAEGGAAAAAAAKVLEDAGFGGADKPTLLAWAGGGDEVILASGRDEGDGISTIGGSTYDGATGDGGGGKVGGRTAVVAAVAAPPVRCCIALLCSNFIL